MTAILAFLCCTALAAPFASADQLDGVNVHSLWSSDTVAQMNAELDIAASAHVRVLRVDVDWPTYQGSGPGQFSAAAVQRLDEFMQGAASRGMKVLPTVIQTPCWASSAPASLRQGCTGAWWNTNVINYPPSDPQTYATFVQWLTARYGSDLAGVEVWNEPNESASWVTSDPATAYAALLKAAYVGAKAGDLNIPVIAGAVAGSDLTFIQQLYAAGIKGYYDGLSIHTYSGTESPLFDPGPGERLATVIPGIESVHALQLANGDHTPLWVTEFGWQTQSGLYAAVTEQQQADYISTAFTAMQALPYVASAIAYDLRDGPSSSNYMDHYGLITADFTPKPALAAMQAALAQPSSQTDSGSSAPAGAVTDTDASVQPVPAAGSGAAPGTGASSPAAGDAPPSSGPAAATTVTTPPTATTASAGGAGSHPTKPKLIVHATTSLGKLRAGNVYETGRRAYRLGIWHVGGKLHVLSVGAQVEPFDMVLTRTSRSVRLVFSRCASPRARCHLFEATVAGRNVVQPVRGIPAGSNYLPAASHGASFSFIWTSGGVARACNARLVGDRAHAVSCRQMKFFKRGVRALASAKSRVVVLRHAARLSPVGLRVVAS